jgi:DNA helicase-2/ATP-dependent DNA helicase PcrA
MIVENEFRVIGPPGCGKTTYLSSQVRARVERWCEQTGQPSRQCHDVLIASLTKAAASEVRGRGLDIPEDTIGTLHSHALRALDNPKLCVSPKAINDWNKASPTMDYWLSGGGVQREEEDGFNINVGKYRGDALHSEYTVYRCRLTPREEWRSDVRAFADAYERWKRLEGYMDYDDLILQAYERDTSPPGNPSTILGDEQQDSSLAELRLMRHWATKVQKLILVGDTDQAIFEWRGASPGGFYATNIPDGHEKTLEQSYRVPRAVHAAAMDMIGRIDDRKKIIYRPREADGYVQHGFPSLRTSPYDAVTEIEKLLDQPQVDPNRPTAMILFPCAYMAGPILAALKKSGIPYWNPYARERGNFNPLHPAKGVSALDRVLKFLKPNQECYGENAKLWTWSELDDWVEMCSAEGWLRRGEKARIKRMAVERPHSELSLDDLDSILASAQVMEELADCKLEFLAKHILAQKQVSFDFILDILKKRSYDGLLQNPRVVVSTIHGAKGSEADHVFICPDLSASGWESYGSAALRDSLHRLFYVGFTRARERLVLTQPSSVQAMRF